MNEKRKWTELYRILLSRVAPGPLVAGCDRKHLSKLERISRGVLDNGGEFSEIQEAIEQAGAYRFRGEKPNGCHVYRITFLDNSDPDLRSVYVGYTCRPIWDRLGQHFGVRHPRRWGKARYPLQHAAVQGGVSAGTRRIRELAVDGFPYKYTPYRFKCLASGLTKSEAMREEQIRIASLKNPLNEYQV